MAIAPHRPSILALAFHPLRDMFVFGGRSTRTEVIGFFVIYIIANMTTVTLYGPAEPLLDAAKLLWAFLWGFPWIALLVRRLHDYGASGWWALVPGVCVPAILFLLLLLTPEVPGSEAYVRLYTWVHHFAVTPPVRAVLLIAFVGSLFQLVLLLMPGTPGANRYGRDPRGRDPVPA